MLDFRVLGSILLVSCSLAACVGDSQLATVEQSDRCPWQACGNSDEVGHFGVWELNVFGEENTGGISILASKSGRAVISKGGKDYQLYVDQGRITGQSPVLPPIYGTGLVGARIQLLQHGAPYYDISITGVRPAGTSFYIGAPDPIETYTFVWHEPGSPATAGKAFCNSVIKQTSDAKTFDLFGMLAKESVAFEGDRFDGEIKTTRELADDSWFNIGCAGHTLAKLYILRHTVHTQIDPDWAQRQTAFKMLVGDYCGTRTNVGETFTLAGEPIAWKGGPFASYPSAAVLTVTEHPLDARWDENGATCLVQPRMQISTHPQAAAEFPNARKQIFDACPSLKTCENDDVQDLDHARIISANRIPLP